MLISLIKYSRPYTHINFQSAKNLVYRQPKRLLTTFEYSGKPTNISQTKEKVKGNKRKKKGNLPPNLRLPTSTPEILTKQPSLNKRESPQGHYFELAEEAYRCSKYILKLPVNKIQQSIQIFVHNLFPISQRKMIPYELYKALYLTENSKNKLSEIESMDICKGIYDSLQVILEFNDKGYKGLLIGDLSHNLITSIHAETEHFLDQVTDLLSHHISNLSENQQRIFLNNYFSIQNNEGNVGILEEGRRDGGEKMPSGYLNKAQKDGLLRGIIDNKMGKTKGMDNRFGLVQILMSQQLQTPSQIISKDLIVKINGYLENMYSKILESALGQDDYRIPVVGITSSKLENPVNVFHRQLLIEEHSFNLAHKNYTEFLESILETNQENMLNFELFQAFNYKLCEDLDNILKIHLAPLLESASKKHGGQEIESLVILPTMLLSKLVVETIMMKVIQELFLTENDTRKLKGAEKIHTEGVRFKTITLAKQIGKQFSLVLNGYICESAKKDKSKRTPTISSIDTILSQNMSPLNINTEQEIKIGAILLSFFSQLTCDQNKHGERIIYFRNIWNDKEKIRTKYVEFSRKIIMRLTSIFGEINMFHQLAQALPMIYPPAPWVSITHGGYYLRKSNIARLMNDDEVMSTIEVGNLGPLCDVLTQLGNVKWRINGRILDVIEYVWASAGGVAKIPPKYDKEIPKEKLKELPKKYKDKLFFEYKQMNADAYSLRCEFVQRLNIARSFRKAAAIYFPHNMDFRGRCYPLSPHLNHMGADMSRGLLEYGDGKPLGKDGFYWLLIHFANCMGKDKLTFPERIQYAEEMTDVAIKCAKDPYLHIDWMKAEDPWQALAAMFEISDALASEDKEKFISHLHIHMDGSFNGMQHYTAIGRDNAAANKVNMTDLEIPGDIYVAVLEKVNEKISMEDDPKFIEYADLLRGKLTRRIVKQTVMTMVYGVTFIGAKKQLLGQLKDKKVVEDSELREKCAFYLAGITLKSIGDTFTDANRIKNWLKDSAKKIGATTVPVKWINPIGLPCVQPYRRIIEQKLLSTELYNMTIKLPSTKQPIHKLRQSTAFPPNFIHSLDATHMFNSAMKSYEKGISFAAVHDSYWCHAADVSTMNVILREEFINLHSRPLLEQFYTNSHQINMDLKLDDIPERGTFDLQEILNSKYFFA